MLQVLRSEYKLFLIIKKKGQNWELEPVLAVESLSLEDTSGIYKLSLLKLEMRGKWETQNLTSFIWLEIFVSMRGNSQVKKSNLLIYSTLN